MTVFEAWYAPNQNWNLFPRRPLFDREIQAWTELTDNLPKPSSTNSSDIPRWMIDPNGRFSVASARLAFRDNASVLTAQLNEISIHHLWKANIPKKCKFFIWTVLHRKLNTTEILQQKFKNMVLGPSCCVLCGADSESLDHIFIHCNFASSIWNRFQQGSSLHTVMPEKVNSLCEEVFDCFPT